MPSNTIDRWRGEAADDIARTLDSVKKQNAEYQANRRRETEPPPKSAPTPTRATYQDKAREDLVNFKARQTRGAIEPATVDEPKRAEPAPSNYDTSKSVPRSDPVAGKPKMSSFQRAFAAARMQGAKEFTFNGKRYNTRRADGK